MYLVLFALLTCLIAPSAMAQSQTLWAAEEVQSERFPDDVELGPLFVAGDRLRVIYEEETRVRVMRGTTDFGWVPRTALTDVRPEIANDTSGFAVPDGFGAPEGGFDAAALQKLIDEAGAR